MTHTVEKFGGTVMSAPQLYAGHMLDGRCYGRIFVVSAYAGMTNRLLEARRSGEAGVFGRYCDGGGAWSDALTLTAQRMFDINARLFERAPDVAAADAFIRDRIESVRTHLTDLQRVRHGGCFSIDHHLPAVRELLAGLGEAHSGFNTVALLRSRGVNAAFVDLTEVRGPNPPPLDTLLANACSEFDLSRSLPVVTGHARCREGLVATYRRGYTEITFSHLAAATKAREAIIHKEYHLSSADPRIVEKDRLVPIERTNYDVADQLALIGMEAIHPGAARVLRRAGIPLRVKCAHEPEHGGTLIDAGYCARSARVEIVTGSREIHALEVFDHEMLEGSDHAAAIVRLLDVHRIAVVARESDANSMTHYLACDATVASRLAVEIERAFPGACVELRTVAVVSVIGSNLKVPDLIASCVAALSDASIPILGLLQSTRAVDLKLIIWCEHFERAIARLHASLVEPNSKRVRRVA